MVDSGRFPATENRSERGTDTGTVGPFPAGPMVRILFPPAASQQRTVPAVGFDGVRPQFTLPITFPRIGLRSSRRKPLQNAGGVQSLPGQDRRSPPLPRSSNGSPRCGQSARSSASNTEREGPKFSPSSAGSRRHAGAVAALRKNLMHRLSCKPISSVPKLANRTPLAVVIDSFLVRTANYAIGDRDGFSPDAPR